MEALKTIRPELLSLSSEQVQALMPYFILFGGTVIAILASVMKRVKPKWPVFILTLLTCALGMSKCYSLFYQDPLILFNGMMISDSYSNFFNLIFLASVAFTALSSFRYLDREQLQLPEYYVMLLFSALGMMLMASSLDLVVIFISLELMSLPVYVLVGFRRADRRSNESSMKYFILGSAASAVLLYGSALLYGATGSLSLKTILSVVHQYPAAMSPIFALGLALVLFGFLFKVAAVPFHMWMPDVYEGAPTPVTGFMTTALKAAAFATLVRITVTLGYGFGQGLSSLLQRHIHDILWGSAVLSMALGNWVALTQTNLKRMLAYSSIAHTGYLLVGVLAGPFSELHLAPVLLYLLSYAVMNFGAFVVLTLLGSREDGGLNLHDLSGVGQRHPILAASMAIFLFSMAGIPPTAGFMSKYILFYSAIQAHEIILVVIAVLCSAVSVYYYLRVLVFMYMRDPVGSPRNLRISLGSAIALAAMVVFTLQIGLMPAQFLDAAKKAISSL